MKVPRALVGCCFCGLLVLAAGIGCNIVERIWPQGPALPDSLVDQLGGIAFNLKIATLQVSDNPADREHVDKTFQKLLEASRKNPSYAEAAEDFEWEIKVIDDAETIDAFALPGGKIALYSGLLRFVETEDQLAMALGHEMVHALARHAAARMDAHTKKALLAVGATETLRRGELPSEAVAGVMSAMGLVYLGVEAPAFTRELEAEADRGALSLMDAAGFNPAHGERLFKRLAAEFPPSVMPPFLRMHPSNEERVKEVHEAAIRFASYREVSE